MSEITSVEFTKHRPHELSIKQFIMGFLNSPKRLGVLFAVTLLIGASLFSWVESIRWFDGLYWAFTTAPTTGFGDISPKTDAGKLVYMTFMPPWFIMSALVVGHVVRAFWRNEHEHTEDEQQWGMDALEMLAAANDVELPPRPARNSTAHLE